MKGKSILLVEDNPNDELLTLRALKKNNILNDVVVARDGEEALNSLFGSAGKPPMDSPAVVLLDLKLPKIDGLEVLRQIRANDRTKFLPVVVLTSSKEESDLINGYKGGANSYVRKPINFEEFAEAVKSIGVYWLLLNEIPAPRQAKQ